MERWPDVHRFVKNWSGTSAYPTTHLWLGCGGNREKETTLSPAHPWRSQGIPSFQWDMPRKSPKGGNQEASKSEEPPQLTHFYGQEQWLPSELSLDDRPPHLISWAEPPCEGSQFHPFVSWISFVLSWVSVSEYWRITTFLLSIVHNIIKRFQKFMAKRTRLKFSHGCWLLEHCNKNRLGLVLNSIRNTIIVCKQFIGH